MKRTIHFTRALVTALCLILLVQGCNQGHDHGATSQRMAGQDDHAALHQPKYGNIFAEFPGHKYAVEIIDEKETTGLVTAFITDAHFDPIAVDATEVRLNFIIDGAPKVFTLTRAEQKEGEPVPFTLTDKELATLNCEGWQGDATVSVVIGGVPYSAKLVRGDGHGHTH